MAAPPKLKLIPFALQNAKDDAANLKRFGFLKASEFAKARQLAQQIHSGQIGVQQAQPALRTVQTINGPVLLRGNTVIQGPPKQPGFLDQVKAMVMPGVHAVEALNPANPQPLKAASAIFQGLSGTTPSQFAGAFAHPVRHMQEGRAAGVNAGIAFGDLGEGAAARPKLRPEVVDALKKIVAMPETPAENIVSGSQTGVFHHGSPFPLVGDKPEPTGNPGRLYLHANPDIARSVAAEKARTLAPVPRVGAYEALKEATGAQARLASGVLDQISPNTKSGLPYRTATPLGEFLTPQGEPFLQPRVTSHFVNSRNAIHTEDIPDPGAIEQAIQRAQNVRDYGWSGHEAAQALLAKLPQLRNASTWGQALKLLDTAHLTDPLSHFGLSPLQTLGIDAVVQPHGSLYVPSNENLLSPELPRQAEQAKEARASAAQILARHYKQSYRGKPLDPQTAVKFIEALKAGKVGPLRDRILLRQALQTENLKPRYHGTNSVYKRPNPRFWDPNSLVGPGEYTTDEPRVADSYVGATNSGQGVGNIRLTTHVAPKGTAFDLEKPITEEQIARIAAGLRKVLQRRSGAGRGYQGGLAPEGAARALLRKLDPGMSGRDAHEELLNQVGWDAELRRQALVAGGFHTLEHEGGNIIGGMGNHSVSVALKPTRSIPTARVASVLQGYQQAVQRIAQGVLGPGATAEMKAQYLREYLNHWKSMQDALAKNEGHDLLPVPRSEVKAKVQDINRHQRWVKDTLGPEGAALLGRASLNDLTLSMNKVAQSLFERHPMQEVGPPSEWAQYLKDAQAKRTEELRKMLRTNYLARIQGDRPVYDLRK